MAGLPPWVRQALEEEQENRRGREQQLVLVWLAQVIRYFHLGESLREALRRRWWDLLTLRLAIDLEVDLGREGGSG